jgi:hypothetical protein
MGDGGVCGRGLIIRKGEMDVWVVKVDVAFAQVKGIHMQQSRLSCRASASAPVLKHHVRFIVLHDLRNPNHQIEHDTLHNSRDCETRPISV